MKYLAIVDDDFISNFRTDDDGLTLVVTDKSGANRAVSLKPLIKATVVLEDGEALYLTQGHIDVMRKYEEEQIAKAEEKGTDPKSRIRNKTIGKLYNDSHTYVYRIV